MDKPNESRTDLLQGYYADHSEAPEYLDQVRAFNLAFRIRTMVQCSLGSSPLTSWRPGFEPAVWEGDNSQRTFLGKHILLDQERKVLYIYHHTNFLKQSLRASRDNNNCDELETVLRQIAIETIDSIQKIFFPLDLECRRILGNLISKGFDPDTAEYYPDDYRRANEHNIIYRHWGSRLIQLHEFVKNADPSRGFWGWCRKRSRKEHLMLVTLLGVLVAAIGIVQSWVTNRSELGTTEPYKPQIRSQNVTEVRRTM
ncbi:hypothetical protein BDV96DRAFT_579480 [Lophiotrema nucula]|uniref:Uncharacterized protein n=1 Tax=Lophiotrema nucula TaxID=690887 RepID=A0A6A5Z273_9PLEO|nr:hypothetical protein BDV96DRAFT_579480 [Lophiotrema nucula]